MPIAAPDERLSFATQHGWGAPALAAAVEGVSWLRRDAPDAAWPAIQSVLQRGAQSIRTWAGQQGIPVDRALRNLIAEAPASDLDLFRVLLGSMRVLGADNADVQQAMLDELGSLAAPDVAAARLASAHRASDTEIEGLLQGSPRRLAEWRTRCHALANPEATAGERVTAALRFSVGLRRRFRLQLVKRSLHLYPAPDLLTAEEIERLAPADIDLLLRWPHLLGRLTGSTTPEQLAELNDRLHAWREATWRLDCAAAADAIALRDMLAPVITRVADDARFTEIPAELQARFEAAIQSPRIADQSAMPEAVRTRFVSRLPTRLRGATTFILTEPSDRLAGLVGLGSPDRTTAVSQVHLTELVAPLLDPARTLAPIPAFARAVSAAGREREVLDVLLDAPMPDAVALPPEPTPDDEAEPAAAIHAILAAWIGATEIQDPIRDRVLLAIGDALPSTGPAARNLAASDPAVIGPAVLLDHLGAPDQREGFTARDATATRAAYLRLARALEAGGWRVSREDATDFDVVAAVTLMPDETVEVLVETGTLLRPEIADLVPMDVLHSTMGAAKQRSRWRQLLAQAKVAGTPLPRRLFPILAKSPSLLELVLWSAAGALPVEAQAEVALLSPVAGRFFDERLSTSDRGALLPHVRTRYADHPNLATAYEVATAFSFAYAPILAALAGAVVVPSEPDRRGRQFDHLYRTYELPKHSGGTRTITAPGRGLKGLQRMLLAQGFNAIPLEAAVTGFRPGFSIRDNATAHVGQPVVVNIDIESFFPSTGYDHILRATRKLCGGVLSERAARFVADICSFQGALPTGAPTSPAIANITLTRIDRALTTAATSRSTRYTRYADDLTFSGEGHALKMVPFARRLLKELGYELDPKKTNIFRRGRRQVVTGLVVNEKADLPRHTRRRLRAALYRREHGGTPTWHDKPMDDAALGGWLAFLGMLRPADGLDGRTRLRAAREKDRA